MCFIVNTNQKYSEKEEYEKYLYIKQTLSKGTITEEENELNNEKNLKKLRYSMDVCDNYEIEYR